jgi:hypothetical protein
LIMGFDGSFHFRFFLWRFISFLPKAILFPLLADKLKRLAPLLVCGWLIDFFSLAIK